MKKVIVLLLAAVLLLSLTGCGEKTRFAEDSELYLTYVAGKSFEAAGGQQLTFYPEGAATYDYQNGVGENHHYNYRVSVAGTTDTQLTLKFTRLVVENKNYHTEDAIDSTEELVIYNYVDNSIEYYLHYAFVYNANTGEGEGVGKGFSNHFGTSITICAEEGCSRYIAPSGNTKYCTEHTAPCIECGDFLDAGETCYHCIALEEAIASGNHSSGSGSNNTGRCLMCNGSGYVKYYYGNSDLEAFLNGYDPYTVGKCTSCGGSGK